MQLLARRIGQTVPDWNHKPFDLDDAYSLCERFAITLVEIPLSTRGFYLRLQGRDVIAVDSRLSDTSKLVVLLHEIGHFLLHVPDSKVAVNFNGVSHKSREEREADLFALCAMIPGWMIQAFRFDESDLRPELWQERLRIRKIYKL